MDLPASAASLKGCVVHGEIQPAKVIHGAIDHDDTMIFRSYVALEGGSVAPGFFYPSHRILSVFILVQIRDENVTATLFCRRPFPV